MASDRLRYMLQEWGFLLPMSSAILTVLYPDEFTIYDIRVCNTLGNFHSLGTTSNFDQLWQGYVDYQRTVEATTPTDFSLLNKDRYLWGQSFYKQLAGDISRAFEKPSLSGKSYRVSRHMIEKTGRLRHVGLLLAAGHSHHARWNIRSELLFGDRT